MTPTIPIPDNETSLAALKSLLRERTVMAAMDVFHQHMGNIFRIPVPGFNPVMLVGPEAARFVLVSQRGDLRWRSEGDPVTDLLHHGVLVEDGDSHDAIRRTMNPALHKQMLGGYIKSMWQKTDQVSAKWVGQPLDMLVEMRRVALLILVDTLFNVDFEPDLERMWTPILKTLKYISPGAWIIWRGIPRPGYKNGLQQMDAYLYQIIRARRAKPDENNDLLGMLITSGIDDHLIRDQLLTMLIAGHDTSTSLLTWALYLLGKHPSVKERARLEVDTVLGDSTLTLEHMAQLHYLDQIIDETLRLYPPIHLGSRVAANDLEFQGYTIPGGTRVMYSIYLTHRMSEYWQQPLDFKPERFEAEAKRAQTPYSFLPFGGGPRNCIGAAFAQIEAKVVLARILQHFDLTLQQKQVRMFMGATLEPRPGILMTARRR